MSIVYYVPSEMSVTASAFIRTNLLCCSAVVQHLVFNLFAGITIVIMTFAINFFVSHNNNDNLILSVSQGSSV